MAGQVLTVVAATVDADREGDLRAAYDGILAEPRPAGLLASALLRGQGGRWEIVTLWRDRAALDAMRAAAETPAAPRVFRQVGAEPVLTVFELVAGIGAAG